MRYGPADSSKTPRFTGVRTFMRLPFVETLDDVDVAVIGVPIDDAVSFKSGARFGPEAIRSASALLRPYNQRTLGLIQEHLEPVHRAGVVPLCLGGDHSMVLAELRAAAAVHGQLALVHLDAHADIWESYYGARYFHGTVFKRAVEEGLVDASASVQAGMRGTLYGESDIEEPRRLGYDAVYWDELEQLTPEAYGDRVRARVGDRPAFLSFDIDFVDPAFAPATGTPEVGGPSSGQALSYRRALTGIDFRAFDCVEVAPVYDQPANITAWVAASACFEMLSLLAVRRRGAAATGP